MYKRKYVYENLNVFNVKLTNSMERSFLEKLVVGRLVENTLHFTEPCSQHLATGPHSKAE
jgi:hypothetical protein